VRPPNGSQEGEVIAGFAKACLLGGLFANQVSPPVQFIGNIKVTSWQSLKINPFFLPKKRVKRGIISKDGQYYGQ
jgi:hypothetical protein